MRINRDFVGPARHFHHLEKIAKKICKFLDRTSRHECEWYCFLGPVELFHS